MLTLTINERDITMSNRQTFRKGTVGAKCKIVFTDFWSKYNKTIVFKPTSKFIGGPFVVYATDMEIEVTIPWEVMSEVGSFRIGVYGTADDEVLPTLWSEYNEVEDATDTSGEAPQDPSPSVYQQILELTTEAVNISNSVREDADAGKFKGDKGDKGDPGKDAVTDLIYNPGSENAQSGKAVAEAINTIPQADWQQNDETAKDYIKNRTHYATKAFEDITWDGDKTDHVMFDLGDGIQYFKVSDRTPSIDELIGGTFTINTPDGEMDFPENLDESFIAEIQGALDIAEENVLIIHNIDVFVEEVLGFTFDNATNGIYFLCNTVEDTYTSKLVSGEKVVKKINEKYLPDISIVAKTGNYNDLKNKPEIDQTYNEGSNNAQSGRAVAQAINKRSVGFSFKNAEAPLSKIKVLPQNLQIIDLTYPKDEDYVVKYIHDNKDMVPVDHTVAENAIAARDSKGNLWTGLPIDDVDCANKKYVDEKTVVDQKFNLQSENAQSGIAISGIYYPLEERVTNLEGHIVLIDNKLTTYYYTKTEVDEALQNVSIDATTTPTADKIPKYNQYGQLIVNCTEYEPGTEKAKVYSGESVPRDLWKAYINNFHQRITNLDNRTTGIDSLFDKKISFQYATADTEVTLKSNCLYLVIDHSGSNNTNVYITKSDNTKVVATTQGDSAVENFPAFRLSLIFVPHDHNHTIVIGQTGKFSLTNFSPLYTKQVIWDSTYKNMFIKTTGTGMSVWEVNI